MKSFLILLPLISLTIFSCKSKDDNLNLPTFEGCCENRAITNESVGNGKIYIPNAILVGSNFGTFTVLADNNISEVILLEVKDINNNILFKKENFRPNGVDAGWDGENINNENRGICSFKVTVRSSDNVERTINGFVCAIYCENNEIIDYDFTRCQFSYQHDGNGGFNPNVGSGEVFPCQ